MNGADIHMQKGAINIARRALRSLIQMCEHQTFVGVLGERVHQLLPQLHSASKVEEYEALLAHPLWSTMKRWRDDMEPSDHPIDQWVRRLASLMDDHTEVTSQGTLATEPYWASMRLADQTLAQRSGAVFYMDGTGQRYQLLPGNILAIWNGGLEVFDNRIVFELSTKPTT